MNQNQFPIKLQEVQRLANKDIFGLDPKSFKFLVTCFESDRYISIADSSPGSDGQFTVIDIANDFRVTKKPLKADQILMHPKLNIISLKAKQQDGTCMIQVFNMDTKQKLKSLNFPDMITFWRWVSDKKLALVTPTSVIYTDIDQGETQQEKVFDKAGSLANPTSQIIGYQADFELKWSALYGISSPDGGKSINGHIQLFLREGEKQQLLSGHCCCFGQAYVHSSDYLSSLFCYVDKKENDPNSKVMFTEIGQPKDGCQKYKKSGEIFYSQEFQNDFPIIMQVSQKYGMLIIITKFGFLFLYELTTGQNVFRTRISNEAIFVGTKRTATDGVYAINKAGSLLSIDIDENALIGYIQNNCQQIPDVQQLTVLLAQRYKLPGCEQVFQEQFNRFLLMGDIAQASKVVATSPGTLLRNVDTINRIKQMPSTGGAPPILVYFQTLLDQGKLNQFESLELVKLVVSQNKAHIVDDWIRNDKLECCEELGDIIRQFNKESAVRVYERCKCLPKQIQTYMELGWQDKAFELSKSTGVSVDYMEMFRREIPINAEGAYLTAKQLCARDPNINVHAIAAIFLENNKIKEMSQFLVDCMKQNKPEDGPWQERVLEMNLMTNQLNVVDLILSMDLWNQFNRQKIAILCEQKGLLTRALENYREIKDVRRVILNTHLIPQDFIVSYMEKMQPENVVICLQDMLKHNRQNLQLAVRVVTQNYAKLNIASVVTMFESVGAFDGIYFFLGAFIGNTTDKDIHFKYIQAAAKCSQINAIETVIREKKDCYDPEQVKQYLMDAKLPDPKPIIFLCDIHGYIDELTRYLYQNNYTKFIEIYLFRVNQNATPQVLGGLIDIECDELYIKKLLYNIRGNCPIEQLIEEFEKRNKLRVLENWLDSRAAEGNQLPSIHNALAKIKIDTNSSPENFLLNNQYYDSKIVGKYCEERDPHLAYQAYKRAWGNCDMELIEVTNKNALYRLQARYLVERQSMELWAQVLSPDNPHRKAIIEQVVSAALPDSKNAEEVSTTVQAFMVADLPNELINLLEKIVLHNSEFGKFKKLQNLLIITAIKADKSKVMDYIKRLDNYDGAEIAKIALGEQYQLYEEAFVIYSKQQLNVEAVDVLINNIESIQRAQDFADKVNQPDVYSRLGNAYLERYLVTDAIECYLKAKDHNNYLLVIQASENDGKFEALIKFLLMARQIIKDANIDNSLSYCYSRLDKLAELEELITNPNSINFGVVGDRCFNEKLYEAAKALYTHIKNNARIASCLVHLKQFQKAIESAKKANTPKTWKELCIACVEAEEFKLAAIAGMNIIIHPDHLEDLMKQYEAVGAQEEMIALLQQGMTLERAHIGIFTELGVLYAKYQPDKLMEHIKVNFQKINVSKLLRVCERYKHWPETVYLYQNYQEFDNAVNIMMEHSPSAFTHDSFVNLIQKVSNHELYYRAMLFYYEQQPLQLNKLLKALSTKIDLTKAVAVMKKTGDIALIAPFLREIQSINNQAVNETLNQIYLESENFEELRKSIEQFDNFEPIALAKFTENHEWTEARRVAAYLYRKTQKYEFSIEISKKDEQYRDCIETAKESGSAEIAENLLKFFVATRQQEFFTVMSYTCYDLLKPDIVIELAWRFGLIDFAMPFFINIVKELTGKIETVQKKHDQQEKKEQKKEKHEETQILDITANSYMNLYNTPMLTMGGVDPFQMQAQSMQSMGGGMMNQSMPGMMIPPGGSQQQSQFGFSTQGIAQSQYTNFGNQYY